jgi:5-methylcytosine-specific restriction endonuclease McrA
MRELVVLRDRHCVFPWCERDSRACDLDHIVPYDEHGPPGQTSPENLATLCRRHHRCKTSGRWSYTRNRDGTYTWHSPHHHTYQVTPIRTVELQ